MLSLCVHDDAIPPRRWHGLEGTAPRPKLSSPRWHGPQAKAQLALPIRAPTLLWSFSAMLGLYTALSVASALLAAADCFPSPSPRVRPLRRSCLSTLGSRPGRPCARVCATMASTLPLEIKECRLFTADGGFDTAEADAFLRGYWQQQPVLLRQALPFESPISPDELAGLSLEEDVASRLIINWGALDAASRPPGKKEYELRVGPFTEDTFTTDVPETCYTLLCNEVSPLIPELSDLAARFQFIPNWRLDDIMISYAATGGGVGPHVDNYDVFLLQGRGRRRCATSGIRSRMMSLCYCMRRG